MPHRVRDREGNATGTHTGQLCTHAQSTAASAAQKQHLENMWCQSQQSSRNHDVLKDPQGAMVVLGQWLDSMTLKVCYSQNSS